MMLNNRDGEKLIYKTINLNIKNNIELLERITSLLYYLISTNHGENERCELTILLDVFYSS